MGRTLSVDYGDRRIGVAVSDILGISVNPLPTLNINSMEEGVKTIVELVESLKVSEIVVGLPLNMKGKDTPQTQKVRKFIHFLKQKLLIPIYQVDERLTSVEAEKILVQNGVKTGHNKSRVDQVSALIILRNFLDAKR
jgi:putative Holliday junction resolvase